MNPQEGGLSRRDFLKIAAAAPLLAACRREKEPLVGPAEVKPELFHLGPGIAQLTLGKETDFNVFIPRKNEGLAAMLDAFTMPNATGGRIDNILGGHASTNFFTGNETGELVEITNRKDSEEKMALSRLFREIPFTIHQLRFDPVAKSIVMLASGNIPVVDSKGQVNDGPLTSSESIFAITIPTKKFPLTNLTDIEGCQMEEGCVTPAQKLTKIIERITAANIFLSETNSPLEALIIPRQFGGLFDEAARSDYPVSVINDLFLDHTEENKDLSDEELRASFWYVDTYDAKPGRSPVYLDTLLMRNPQPDLRLPIGAELCILGIAQNTNGEMYALVNPTQKTYAKGQTVDSRITHDGQYLAFSNKYFWLPLSDLQLRPDQPQIVVQSQPGQGQEGFQPQPPSNRLKATVYAYKTEHAPTFTSTFTSTPTFTETATPTPSATPAPRVTPTSTITRSFDLQSYESSTPQVVEEALVGGESSSALPSWVIYSLCGVSTVFGAAIGYLLLEQVQFESKLRQ